MKPADEVILPTSTMLKTDFLASVAAALVYLTACTWQLSLQHLQYDERTFAAQAVNFVCGTVILTP